jgi:Spy/CpxP family protein refolding chaperone
MKISVFCRAGLLALSVALLSPAAFAQRPGGPAMMGPGGMRQRGSFGPDLAKQLSLTPAQKKKFDALQSNFRQKMMSMRNSSSSMDQRRSKMDSLRGQRDKAILAILTKPQQVKYKSLMAQRRFPGPGGPGRPGGMGMGMRGGRGMNGMMDRMKTELKLTPQQQSKISSIMKASQAKQESLRKQAAKPNANQEKIRSQFRANMQDSMKKIQAVLTPQQRAKMQSMMPRRGPGGPGGGPYGRPGGGGPR